jgi:hypothetical protein
LRLFLILTLMLGAMVVVADVDRVETTTYERVALHEGPGHTYFPTDILNPGLPIQVVERNAIGNWVRVQRLR